MGKFFEDLIDFLSPDERLGLLIIKPNEILNARNKLRNASKHATSDLLAGQFSEPAFDQIQPRATRRREVHMKTGMLLQPLFNMGMRMRSIVVQDQMEIQPPGRLAVDLTQKLQIFLVTMPRVTTANNRPLQDVQRREQRRRPVPLIVMGHRPTPAFLHRQPRLSPVQGLNLRLLINAQNQRFLGGIQVKPDHIGELLHKPSVFRQFKGLDSMRLKPMGFPDSGHGHVTHPDLLGQRPRAPMGGVRRTRMQGSLYDQFDSLGVEPSRTRPVGGVLRNPGRTILGKPTSPKNNGRPGRLQPYGDGVVGDPVGGEKANAGAEDDPLGRRAGIDPDVQSPSLFQSHGQGLRWIPHALSLSCFLLIVKILC